MSGTIVCRAGRWASRKPRVCCIVERLPPCRASPCTEEGRSLLRRRLVQPGNQRAKRCRESALQGLPTWPQQAMPSTQRPWRVLEHFQEAFKSVRSPDNTMRAAVSWDKVRPTRCALEKVAALLRVVAVWPSGMAEPWAACTLCRCAGWRVTPAARVMFKQRCTAHTSSHGRGSEQGCSIFSDLNADMSLEKGISVLVCCSAGRMA